MDSKIIQDQTKEYYGKTLQKTTDLQTNACCTSVRFPKHILAIIKLIHDDVISSYYGCGLVIPDCLHNASVLDLGSGSGKDAYILSKLVGQNGYVVGVDMTDEQLAIATKHIDHQTSIFGFSKPNVSFMKGYIEKLDALELSPESFDVIVSNCVVNLSIDKFAVFQQSYSLLKKGGEMYFSDVYSDRRIPHELAKDPVLWGECLSGALYLNDFLSLVKQAGFIDPRMVSINPITVKNKELEEKLGNIKFYSITYRLFKLPGLLDDNCEDYGQAVRYQGTIDHAPQQWKLDDHHVFEIGKISLVCRNTFNMLYHTRFRDHFSFYGSSDPKTHYGVFEGCGQHMPFDKVEPKKDGGCC